MSDTDSRKAFEAWAVMSFNNTTRRNTPPKAGCYLSDETEGLWQAWSARDAEIEAKDKRIAELEAQIAKSEKWFADNASTLANHRIGGYKFDE